MIIGTYINLFIFFEESTDKFIILSRLKWKARFITWIYKIFVGAFMHLNKQYSIFVGEAQLYIID